MSVTAQEIPLAQPKEKIVTNETETQLNSVLAVISQKLSWLWTPTEIGRQIQARDLPLPSPSRSDQLAEAAHILTAKEDQYHQDLDNPKNRIRYQQAKVTYEKILNVRDEEKFLAELKADLPDQEKAFEDDEITAWEWQQAKLLYEEQKHKVGELPPPQLAQYFDYLKQRESKKTTTEASATGEPAFDIANRLSSPPFVKTIFWEMASRKLYR